MLLFNSYYIVDTLSFTPAKILLFNGLCKYVQRRFNKEDGVHIVRGVYAMLQSITKVFISIGYVSVMYRLCIGYPIRRLRGGYEEIGRIAARDKQGMSKG